MILKVKSSFTLYNVVYFIDDKEDQVFFQISENQDF